MNRPIKHQHGAVAIIVALSILLLIMIIGLVVDLGFLYTRKTELQNAADAAALAGAKKLDGTAVGIKAAADAAIAMAALNNVDFGGEAIDIDYDNLGFSSTPDGCIPLISSTSCAIGLDAQTSPGNKFFVTVDTSGILQGSHPTFFMRVAGFDSTTTYGMAVAGSFVTDVMPLGICALDKNDPDYGFLRGVAYNLTEEGLSPIANGDMGWLDPVATNETDCDPSNSNASYPMPFICRGESVARATPGFVISNTGWAAGKTESALNSRFGANNNSNYKYDRAYCPPDSNIKQYSVDAPNAAPPGADAINPSLWMNPDPTQQTITFDKTTDKPSIAGFSDYGALWTYARPTGKTVGDWPALYGGNAESYPEASPYAQTTPPFFKAPSSSQGLTYASRDRRVLNVVIVDCSGGKVGGSCKAIPTLAIGKFFMQREARIPQHLDAEFAGITSSSSLTSDIRLYR